MKKNTEIFDQRKSSEHTIAMVRQVYKETLHRLQIELVKLQRHFIKCADKRRHDCSAASAARPGEGRQAHDLAPFRGRGGNRA